jgi:uncharacterized protein YndB with AHSA1/START domain
MSSAVLERGAGVYTVIDPPHRLAYTFGDRSADVELVSTAGGVLVVETCYHLLVKASEGTAMNVLWLQYDAKSPWAWSAIVVLFVAGGMALRKLSPYVAESFHDAVQQAQSKGAQ